MGTGRSTLVWTFSLAAGVALASGCASGTSTNFGVSPPPPGDDCACCGPTNGQSNGGCGDDVGPSVEHPSFGPLVTASKPPPSISGGTLFVSSDGKTAIAADSDRDVVHIVDISAQKVTFDVALQSGDEPGRVIEDGAGRVHVALRGGGAVVSIDPTKGAILERRSVCPAPRGLAWDPPTDTVLVACATGELVSLPAAGGAATRTVVVERDLRDVIDQAGVITVTKFRSAELLRLAADGSIARRISLPTQPDNSAPHVAWRAIPLADGGILITHQSESLDSVDVQTPHGYGGGGGGSSIVESVVTRLDANGNLVRTDTALFEVVLPVDIAVSPGGKWAVASPGTAFFPGFGTFACSDTLSSPPVNLPTLGTSTGQVVAVAFADDGHLIVQSREPARLAVVDVTNVDSPTVTSTVELSSVSRDDTGHDIFHVQAGASLACASCHPEGGDDGHVWNLSESSRRTPSLRGTIAGTAPYHWPGDQVDVPTLVGEVYTQRMSGMQLDSGQMGALQHWVEAIPAPPAPSWVDSASAQRGQAIFAGAQAGCGGCHAGPKFTNNATLDVGTGGAFQVPPLVGVGWRTPLLHDGCAATIADRFGTCSTPKHGNLSTLSAQDLSDLGNYLETL